MRNLTRPKTQRKCQFVFILIVIGNWKTAMMAIEDNDDISRFEKSDILNDVSQTSDIIGDKYGNSSSEITTKTLAPQDQTTMTRRILNLFEDPANNESSQQQLEVPHTKEDDSILANSSNIAPPEELTLPVVEANDYSSFNDVTKTFDAYSSFEESLSREARN